MLNKIISTSLLEKSLDAAWLRNEVASQNIANIDTPGYKRKTVKFEDFLKEATSSGISGRITNERHIPINSTGINNVVPVVAVDNNSRSIRLDGNNVDIENEMAQMAKNTIQYNTLVQKINGEFRKLKSAISEGRK